MVCFGLIIIFVSSLKGRLRGIVTFFVLPSFRPYRDVENRCPFPPTELTSLRDEKQGDGFYSSGLPSLRDVEHGRLFLFRQALAPDGAIRDRCGFAQACTARRHVPPVQQFRKAQHPRRMPCPDRYNSSVKGHHLDECLVPKGQKLGRNGVHGRVTNAPSGAKPHRRPQLSRSRLRKLMASLRCPSSISLLPSRSAMVRATFRMRS